MPSFGFSGLVVSLFGYLELCPGGGAVGQASRWLRGAADALGGRGKGRTQEPPLPLLRPPLELAQRAQHQTRVGGVVTYPPAARSKDSS